VTLILTLDYRLICEAGAILGFDVFHARENLLVDVDPNIDKTPIHTSFMSVSRMAFLV